jgi:hypothetical protein
MEETVLNMAEPHGSFGVTVSTCSFPNFSHHATAPTHSFAVERGGGHFEVGVKEAVSRDFPFIFFHQRNKTSILFDKLKPFRMRLRIRLDIRALSVSDVMAPRLDSSVSLCKS